MTIHNNNNRSIVSVLTEDRTFYTCDARFLKVSFSTQMTIISIKGSSCANFVSTPINNMGDIMNSVIPAMCPLISLLNFIAKIECGLSAHRLFPVVHRCSGCIIIGLRSFLLDPYHTFFI